MTDDLNDKQPQPRSRRRAPDDAVSPPPADDDSMAALERLQSLTSATVAPSTRQAPSTAARRPSRPRPAAAPRAGRMVARMAAPAVFLVAVLIVLSIVFQSGVIGGNAEPAVTPTPKSTKTKSGGNAKPTTYKLYVIKSGDTMSGIAVKFHVSTSEIEALNPKMSLSLIHI